MTTRLQKPLARELVLDEVPFKVVISPEGVRIMRKGRRTRAPVSWETILRLSEMSHQQAPTPSAAGTGGKAGLPISVAGEVAIDIVAASSALTRAKERISAAGELPPELRMQMDPDPVFGEQDRRTDWYIEPLLTPAEVASVLRLSVAAVGRLPIRWIELAGERRYRQSEVRHFVDTREREGLPSRW